jgi:hypothetical protein
LPRGLPSWFVLRNTDGDAQLTMAEYAPKPTQSQLDEFARYDRNGDGLLTAEECALGPGPIRGKAPAASQAGEETAEEAPEEPIEATAESVAGKAKARNSSRKNRSKKLLKPSSKSADAKSG